jgi:phage terminase large subunit
VANFATDFRSLYHAIGHNKGGVFLLCDVLHFTPSPQQRLILECYDRALFSKTIDPARFITAKAGQGVGKTTIEVVIAMHWVLRREGARMRVLATSIDQLKDTWMAEFRQLLEKADDWLKLLFKCRSKDIIVGGKIDWGIRLIPAQDATRVQGRHHKYLAFLVDECSGIDRTIFETIMATLTNDDKFLGIFGNPNYRDTFQFDTFDSMGQDWTQFTLNAEDCPFADQANIARLARLYGTDSDVYRVRVLGEFPKTDPQAVMSSDDIRQCHYKNKDRMLEMLGMYDLTKQIGIDFASKGDDASVIAMRSGAALVDLRKFNHVEPINIVDHAIKLRDKHMWGGMDPLFMADFDGLGGGTGGYAPWSTVRCHQFHSQHVPMDQMFDDAVTEAFFQIAERVKNHEIYLPLDPELIQNLSTRNFDLTKQGKVKIESKKDWRKRLTLSKSPDTGDAVVLAYYDKGNLSTKVASGVSLRLPTVAMPHEGSIGAMAREVHEARVATRVGSGTRVANIWNGVGR